MLKGLTAGAPYFLAAYAFVALFWWAVPLLHHDNVKAAHVNLRIARMLEALPDDPCDAYRLQCPKRGLTAWCARFCQVVPIHTDPAYRGLRR